jgi:N-acetylglutamate synthase-like GNAT family acetyltransferase
MASPKNNLNFNELNHVILRTPHSNDAAKLADLINQLGYPCTKDTMEERIKSLVPGISSVCVAEIKGTIIGYAALDITHPFHLNNKIARLTSLIVDSPYRGKGIGKLLMTHTENIARNNQCEYIELTSGVQRTDAHRFYTALGYLEFNDKTRLMSKLL